VIVHHTRREDLFKMSSIPDSLQQQLNIWKQQMIVFWRWTVEKAPTVTEFVIRWAWIPFVLGVGMSRPPYPSLFDVLKGFIPFGPSPDMGELPAPQ